MPKIKFLCCGYEQSISEGVKSVRVVCSACLCEWSVHVFTQDGHTVVTVSRITVGEDQRQVLID